MSHARRRRTLRCTVLTATLAVLASFVIAPAAQAETPPADPTTSAGPTDAESVPASSTDVPSEPAGIASGDTVVGELVQAWPDPTAEEHAHEDAGGHHDEAPLSWIEPAEGDAVRVPTEALPDVAVGSTLAVTVGDEVVDEASAEQGFEPAVEVQAATVLDAATPDPTTASAGTAPTNTVTAVLVLPAGASSDGMTIGSVVGTLNGAVSSFWNEQSNGTVRIAAVQGASGWIRSAQTCSSPYALWDDVAAQIGWTGGAGKHLMLYVPANASGCAYGLGTVGSSIGSGGRAYVQASALSVMAHELGHNFGLGHSSELQCNASVESGTCQTRSYYDFYDVMGISWAQVGTLNAAQAARLGLLPAGEQVALTSASAATTVDLAPASATSGVRAVKLTASDGTVYYLEYRQASGQDAWLGDARNAYRLDSGVVLRRAAAADGNTSLLLDGTPSASSAWASDLQQALPVGSAVTIASSAFRVTVLSTSTTGASVRIRADDAMSRSTVDVGEIVTGGQSRTSVTGGFKLEVQGDGNLVLSGPGNRVAWASQVYSPGARVTMQADGNLVQYSAGGRVLWNAGTWGNAGATAVVRDDGSLAVITSSGTVVWATAALRPDSLVAGQALYAGQSLVSPGGGVRLVLQVDGNLVGYAASGRVIWASGTYGPGSYLRVQDDGNAVLYAPSGRVMWTADTWNNPGARLVLRDDGSAAVLSASGPVLWQTAALDAASLRPGQSLFAGQSLTSASGGFRLTMQTDGNLVAYTSSGGVLWSSAVYAPGGHLVMQMDGNLVSYDPTGVPVWSTGTWGQPGLSSTLGTDGVTRLMSPGGATSWSR